MLGLSRHFQFRIMVRQRNKWVSIPSFPMDNSSGFRADVRIIRPALPSYQKSDPQRGETEDRLAGIRKI